ncbi:uncharacterized protein LOC131440391 isoform X2 [Malaya genurostris]|nr:uncharacterized protein LOC131440391 isoform X2 [Malaya genurostris]XP_058467635.1 uncharacterized protein LOC131440391 isoform X2 [Malaya genurostris]
MFNLLDGFISQRHTLQLWRSVRLLEKRLHKESDQISDNNRIIIADGELVAAVIYTFNIVGIDADGTKSQGQNFTIIYRGKNARSSVDRPGSSSSNDVSLILLGAEVSYSDVPFLMTAKLIFCNPRNNYKVQWKIPGVIDTFKSLETQSNMLEIPAGILFPNSSYELIVTIFDTDNGEEIIGATMKLSILKRATKGFLYPVETLSGYARSTKINFAFNRAFDGNFSLNCVDGSGDDSCSKDLVVAGNSIHLPLKKVTRYTTTVSTEDFKTLSIIVIDPKSTISVTLQKQPPLYLIPGQRYDITAEVSGLVPKCSCNWTVVNEKGYAHFDAVSVDTLGGIIINNIEENFLSELVDYGNDTVEREVKLSIPAMINTSNQSLLLPDALYKFRLITKCPEPIDDSVNNSDVKPSMVNSYWDIILETNAPPKGIHLEVSPIHNGTAMSTLFTLSTGTAKDLDMDYPLRYSYWYTVEGNSINIADYYDVTSTETKLPYSPEKIVTYYIVCDSRDACSRVSGPLIATNPNLFLDEPQIQFWMDEIQQNFNRGHFLEATKIAFETLLTLKNQESVIYDKTYSDLMIILREQIPAIQKAFVEGSFYIKEEAILRFAQQVKFIIEFKHGSQDHLLGQLLKLVDCIERKTKRQTRSASPKPITNIVDTTSTKFELYKSLIKSPNGTRELKGIAKVQLLSYIPEAAQRYCSNQQTGYSDEWFSLETTRLKPSIKYPPKGSIRIPGDTIFPQRAVLSGSGGPKIETLLDTASYLCLGTVIFNVDLLSTETPNSELSIYHVFMMVVDKYEFGVLVEWTTGSYLWNITVASDSPSNGYRCQLWSEGYDWTDKFCSNSVSENYVLCNCSQLSYLRIISRNMTNLTSIVQISTTTTAPAKEQPKTTHVIPPTVIFKTTTDTDMMTFAPLHTTSITGGSISTPTSNSSSNNASQDDTLPEYAIKPSSAVSVVNNTFVNITLENIGNLRANLTRHQLIGGTSGPLGYSIIAALTLCAILTVVALVLYKRRRRTTTLAEELQVIASRVRSQSLPVRYARFQDEHNMSGDNVSTISDTITV